MTGDSIAPHHRERLTFADACARGKCRALPGQPCRDATGRPYVFDPVLGKHVTYTRASTLAKSLDDDYNLTGWKQRITAIGLLQRPGLQTRLAGVLASGDPEDTATRREINAIVAEAFEAGGGSDKASAGTGFHALAEALDAGRTPFIPDADRPRLDAYRAATRDYTFVAAEQFTVNDLLRVGGSFDRLLLCPDGRVRVADIKSGKWDAEYPGGVAMQMAVYARSHRYDPATGHRTALDPRLDPTIGLLISMPPRGGCEVIPIDLERGWYMAQVAADVRAVRSYKAADFRTTFPRWDDVLAEARTLDVPGLRDLWKRAHLDNAPEDIRAEFERIAYSPEVITLTRFMEKVNTDGPTPDGNADLGQCWIWTRATNAKGYGRFGLGAHKSVAAHRWIYEAKVAPIPEGMTLDHLCRTTGCVNPAHMEVVTRAENNRRANDHRRQAKEAVAT